MIDAINKQYQKGTIDFDSALAQLKDIRDQYHRQFNRKHNFNADNVKILDKYFEHKYAHKDIKRKSKAYARLKQAVQALDDLSINTSSRDELQAKIAKKPQQRRFAAALNQLLKYIGRTEVELALNRKRITKPKYLTEHELNKLIKTMNALSFKELHYSKEDKALFTILMRSAYGTGMRLGELYALKPASLRLGGKAVYVDEQMLEDLTFDEVKNRKPRMTPIMAGFEKDVMKWAKVPLNTKKKLRNYRHFSLVQKLCSIAFKDQTDKQCKFHDLRHSFAIAMGLNGESLDTIAQCLGNSKAVCEEYYKGFTLTQEGIEALVQRISNKAG